MAETRERWKSRTGFLLAAIGSAIGLGNIWRFNYICFKNGGGAFLIPYLTALVVAGISLLLLEYVVGHRARGSAPVAYSLVGKKWEWVGWMTVNVAMFGILIYYVVVLAWCANFLSYSFSMKWGEDPGNFFLKDYLGLTSGPWEIGSLNWHIVIALAVVWALNWFITYKGVQRGIELACKIFMPLLLVLTIILVIRGLTLPGAYTGIKWYLTPDFSKLGEFSVWQDAFSQIFFSIGVGFGIMIAYSSYLPRKANLTGNAMITALTNSAFSLFMAFAVFSTLGYMATETGQQASDVVKSGPTLAFVVFPKAISLMPFAPQFFALLFFSCLLVAGLSSSISILEGFGSGLMDKFGFSRRKTVTTLCVIGFLGGLIYCTGAGLFWLDIVDHFIMNYGAVPLAVIECIVFGWLIKGVVKNKRAKGAEFLMMHINDVSDRKIRSWWVWIVKIVIPGILSIITLIGLYNILTKGYEGYPVSALLGIGVGAILIFLIIALCIAFKPWHREKHLGWEDEEDED
ncbi:MAG: sodium-dependent transporter [Candidatus Coatesbacteria bacterium]|nr:sodium-dependent transporter [Candidatus Coatesbacteria bacterium]